MRYSIGESSTNLLGNDEIRDTQPRRYSRVVQCLISGKERFSAGMLTNY